MAEDTAEHRVIIEHPARDKVVVKATKAVVVLLLLASAGLMVIVTYGGWQALAGMQVVQIGYIVVYVVLAYFCARWQRGVLPVAAALGLILLILAAVAGPLWFDRDRVGYTQPNMDADMVGFLTLMVIPLQVLLIAFAMRGFQQDWHVEIELPQDDGYGSSYGPGEPAAGTA
jgi:presenilin-like A22 family membrane protease